jgi:hypothetical protein
VEGDERRGREGRRRSGGPLSPLPPAVAAALDAALDPFNRALAAFLGVAQPPKGERVPWADLATAAALPK